MKYKILKPTKCHVANHVWIWDSSNSSDEPSPDLRCDCDEYSWADMSAFHGVHPTGGGLCANCGQGETDHPNEFCLAFIPASG